MKVWVSGKQFVLPRQCACCGAYPVTQLAVFGSERNRLSRTRGWEWHIPYCKACQLHIRRSDLALLAVYIVGAATVLAALLTSLWFGGFLDGVVVLTLGSALDLALYKVLTHWIRRHATKNCDGLYRAVRYLGSTGHCHAFDLRSPWFAKEFIRANHRKLVNVRVDVAGVLRGLEFGDHQVPRRLIRSGR